MNYYEEIKNKLIDNEVYSRVKDYFKERHKVITYYNVGKLLAEAGKHYGDNIIGEYSKRLIIEVGKGYNTTNLKRMRQFYLLIEKGALMGHQLSWSHYRELIPLKNIEKINYYINLCENNLITRDELKRRINNKEYERLPIESKRKLIINDKVEVKDLVPNPILIRNKNNIEIVTEKVLHRLILEDIESFMKELGIGFCFIGSEYKIKIGDRYNYIDLLLFNVNYNCYVVVELKVTELKKEHLGQIQVYMNYIDENVKKINHEKTI